MQMVMFVLDDPDQLDAVLDAWELIGVSGVTIIESTGINRRRLARQVGAPFMSAFNRMAENAQEGHFTLLTVVPGRAKVQECITAVEQVVGDISQPNRGVLVTWPLDVVIGVPPQPTGEE